MKVTMSPERLGGKLKSLEIEADTFELFDEGGFIQYNLSAQGFQYSFELLKWSVKSSSSKTAFTVHYPRGQMSIFNAKNSHFAKKTKKALEDKTSLDDAVKIYVADGIAIKGTTEDLQKYGISIE